MTDDRPWTVAIFAALVALLSASAAAAEAVKINEIVIAASIPDAQRDATVAAARAFYDFWDTGRRNPVEARDRRYLHRPHLPAGRPQGSEGPVFASRQFRGAVPDLNVVVEKMVVAGDYVTVHTHFTGHFTGKFDDTIGKGQPIAFIATDLLKVENGRITDNWHIEDNLTLLKQMGLAKIGS
jgi:predicted ester cyclase